MANDGYKPVETKEDNMWVDARNCEPLNEGEYMIQTVFGDVRAMSYTPEYGWNTCTLSDGSVCNENRVRSSYIARWLSVPTPNTVPEKWLDEFMKGA